MVNAIDDHRDLDVLALLPALEELEICNFALPQGDQRRTAVIAGLRARGVNVHG
ncbi:hypothetical protein ACPPVO_44205 [Dactylosporangium sp. McL0621]|uniref:hypothetical protein n=1 Tax=Dactylosporangium sp. McL0621 TaxID=3415678 RepID=UPI003CFB4FC1